MKNILLLGKIMNITRGMVMLLCLFFGAVLSAHGQGLKVSVYNDLQESLPYAYIYVNGRAVAVADTLGLAVIPQDKLHIGDTISVSYVATEGQTVVFDQKISQKGEYQFVLPEIYAALLADAVIVKADIEKLYRKHVKTRWAYQYGSIWNTDFSMRVGSSNDSIETRLVDGKLKIAHQNITFNNKMPLKITTHSDTTDLSKNLQIELVYALESNKTMLNLTRNPDFMGSKVRYGYLGKDEHHRTFRLSYSEIVPGITYQIILKSDIKTGDIHQITMNMLDMNDGSTVYIESTIRNTKKKAIILVPYEQYGPKELEYHFEHQNGTTIDITMKNIDYEFVLWNDKKKKAWVNEVSR